MIVELLNSDWVKSEVESYDYFKYFNPGWIYPKIVKMYK